jgi:hypothetical protein
MVLTITDQVMTSPDTPHTAQALGDRWAVSWLPGRMLTKSQATTAMMMAEVVSQTPAGSYSESTRRRLDNWAAELGLTGPGAALSIIAGPPADIS